MISIVVQIRLCSAFRLLFVTYPLKFVLPLPYNYVYFKDITMKKQYKIIKLPKGHGKFRTIYAPSKAYKTKLKTLLLDLQQKLHNLDEEKTIQGFMRGRGPVSNAQKHVGYDYTLSLDLEDFFDSVTVEMASKYLSEEEKSLCFIDGIARQGLPTSPLIANLAFYKLDVKIKEALSEVGAYVVYTRYADDMIFSFNKEEMSEMIISLVTEIVTKGGFKVNTAKTKLQSAKQGRRQITGLSVGDRAIHPTRKLKRKIRAALHQKRREQAFGLLAWAECKEPNAFYTDRDLLNKNIFYDDALDLSNDFYLSDLLSFEEYVTLVEDDFNQQAYAHEKDPKKWKRQKEAFLEQREQFYQKEKQRSRHEAQKVRAKIEERFMEEEQEQQPIVKKTEQKSAKKPNFKKATQGEKVVETNVSSVKELAVDFDTLKESELEEVEKFQKERLARRHVKNEQAQKSEEVQEQKRALNKIFTWSIAPIVLLIMAMSYYFGNTEVEVKPTYPLFVKATPYDARIQILNIKPKYKMGIELKPGKYDILITKKGYNRQRFWITMEHEPVVVERELKKIKKRKVY